MNANLWKKLLPKALPAETPQTQQKRDDKLRHQARTKMLPPVR